MQPLRRPELPSPWNASLTDQNPPPGLRNRDRKTNAGGDTGPSATQSERDHGPLTGLKRIFLPALTCALNAWFLTNGGMIPIVTPEVPPSACNINRY